MGNVVNFTEPKSKRVQDFIDKGGKVKVISPEQTARTLARLGGGHYNSKFSGYNGGTGSYEAAGRENIGKYKKEKSDDDS